MDKRLGEECSPSLNQSSQVQSSSCASAPPLPLPPVPSALLLLLLLLLLPPSCSQHGAQEPASKGTHVLLSRIQPST